MKQITKNNVRTVFLLVCLLALLGLDCRGEENATRKFLVTAGGDLFYSSSSDYRQVYGQAVLMPGVKITYLVYRSFAVWSSFSFIRKDGFIEAINEATHISQTMLGFGLGYAHKFSPKLRWRGELGLASVSFEEEAMDESCKGSGLGWKIGVNLDYFIGKRLFATLCAAYSLANNEAETGKIQLGGFQLGAGLGFVF